MVGVNPCMNVLQIRRFTTKGWPVVNYFELNFFASVVNDRHDLLLVEYHLFLLEYFNDSSLAAFSSFSLTPGKNPRFWCITETQISPPVKKLIIPASQYMVIVLVFPIFNSAE